MLEKAELIRHFGVGLFGFSVEADDVFILLVRKLKDIHFTSIWQGALDALAVSFNLCRAGAKTDINTELAHLKPHVQKSIPKISRCLALGLFHNRKVKHHQHPHKPITGQHC